ncbi:hypothetical protein C8F04DRAFT_1179561 [Mycena alexandri]|uniref:Uncharacterized protein n=1 Tax=Mycena alexandri TaxID=1745969 RepID=A0AAD6X4C3_9AGAR|nr:hypothetical protein C8F04DRAFT_1179561 [Mycena alexandri]
MAKSKRCRTRIPKENRNNLRLWAEGTREEVLLPHVEPYADTSERGWRSERKYFQRVCNEYHVRISWRLEDHQEPDLPLLPFDPDAMLPVPEKLSAAELLQKETRQSLLDGRIRRWLKYRVKVLRKHLRTKVDSTRDPFAILLAKLAGVTAPPKARQAYQQFQREAHATIIEPVVQARWAQTAAIGSSVSVQKEPNVNFRSQIARELLAALPDSEREVYATRAKDEAAEARAAYMKALKAEPSKSPHARQLAIDNVGTFIAPILQGIHKRTGMHSVLILGGPVPQYGGDLRTIHVSYGRNRTAVGSHFPHWAKGHFNAVLELMKEYLHTVFTPQDSLEAVLPTGLEGATLTIDPESDESDSSIDSNDSSDAGSESDSGRPRKRGKDSPKTRRKRAVTSTPTSTPVSHSRKI